MNPLKTEFSEKRLLHAVWCLVFAAVLVSTGYAQVGQRPTITNQPSDSVVLDNASVTFRVGASSFTILSYKWYHDSNLISGATASTYTIDQVRLRSDRVNGPSHVGSYHVEVINAAGSTLSRVARLTILASNDIPVANNDNYTTQEGVPLTIPAAGLLANDVDLFPGPLTAVLVSNANHGTVSLSPNGSFTYNPSAGYSGSDSFTYRTRDGETAILEQNSSGENKEEIRNNQSGAQSFRRGTAAGPAYSVKKVVLRLSKKAGQTNNLSFAIRTSTNSRPITGSSRTINMASISNTTEGASFQNYEIVYNTPLGPFKAGTNYYLTLDHSPNGAEVFVETSTGSTYPRGTYFKGGVNDSKDMRFEIHEETVSGVASVTINVTRVAELLRFVSQQRTTNGMKLELSGPGSSIYVIQASTNFTDWTSISTNFTDSGNVVFTDTGATNNAVCVYRAMIPAATNLQQNVSGGSKVKIKPRGAQSFRHGTAGGSDYGISKIVFWISKDASDPNGNLIFSIGTGKNSGALAGSTFSITPASVVNNTGGGSFQRYEIVYPEPIGPFTAGTTYYLNFLPQSTNGKEYWLERSSKSTYSGGTFYRGSNLGSDMRFEIVGQ